MMRLILVRHGQTEWNLLRRTQGQKNSPLTEKGMLQAQLAGKALSDFPIDCFFCSDAGRAVQTADLIREMNPTFPLPQLDARLRELNFGDWEGMSLDEILQSYPEQYASYKKNSSAFRAPRGESLIELQNRVKSFLSDMAALNAKTCLVVAHAVLISIALLFASNRELQELSGMPTIPEASISTLENNTGRWVVTEAPNVRHLEELRAKER